MLLRSRINKYICIVLLFVCSVSINKDFLYALHKNNNSIISTTSKSLNLTSKFLTEDILSIIEEEGKEYLRQDPKKLEKDITAKIFNKKVSSIDENLKFKNLHKNIQEFFIYAGVKRNLLKLFTSRQLEFIEKLDILDWPVITDIVLKASRMNKYILKRTLAFLCDNVYVKNNLKSITDVILSWYLDDDDTYLFKYWLPGLSRNLDTERKILLSYSKFLYRSTDIIDEKDKEIIFQGFFSVRHLIKSYSKDSDIDAIWKIILEIHKLNSNDDGSLKNPKLFSDDLFNLRNIISNEEDLKNIGALLTSLKISEPLKLYLYDLVNKMKFYSIDIELLFKFINHVSENELEDLLINIPVEINRLKYKWNLKDLISLLNDLDSKFLIRDLQVIAEKKKYNCPREEPQDIIKDITRQIFDRKMSKARFDIKFDDLKNQVQDFFVYVGMKGKFRKIVRILNEYDNDIDFFIHLEKLIDLFGKEFLKENWQDFLNLGINAKENVSELFGSYLLKLKRFSCEAYWNDLRNFILRYKGNLCKLFENRQLDFIKKLKKVDWIVVEKVILKASNSNRYILEYAVLSLCKMINKEDNLKEVVDTLVTINEHYNSKLANCIIKDWLSSVGKLIINEEDFTHFSVLFSKIYQQYKEDNVQDIFQGFFNLNHLIKKESDVQNLLDTVSNIIKLNTKDDGSLKNQYLFSHNLKEIKDIITDIEKLNKILEKLCYFDVEPGVLRRLVQTFESDFVNSNFDLFLDNILFIEGFCVFKSQISNRENLKEVLINLKAIHPNINYQKLLDSVKMLLKEKKEDFKTVFIVFQFLKECKDEKFAFFIQNFPKIMIIPKNGHDTIDFISFVKDLTNNFAVIDIVDIAKRQGYSFLNKSLQDIEKDIKRMVFNEKVNQRNSNIIFDELQDSVQDFFMSFAIDEEFKEFLYAAKYLNSNHRFFDYLENLIKVFGREFTKDQWNNILLICKKERHFSFFILKKVSMEWGECLSKQDFRNFLQLLVECEGDVEELLTEGSLDFIKKLHVKDWPSIIEIVKKRDRLGIHFFKDGLIHLCENINKQGNFKEIVNFFSIHWSIMDPVRRNFFYKYWIPIFSKRVNNKQDITDIVSMFLVKYKHILEIHKNDIDIIFKGFFSVRYLLQPESSKTDIDKVWDIIVELYELNSNEDGSLKNPYLFSENLSVLRKIIQKNEDLRELGRELVKFPIRRSNLSFLIRNFDNNFLKQNWSVFARYIPFIYDLYAFKENNLIQSIDDLIFFGDSLEKLYKDMDGETSRDFSISEFLKHANNLVTKENWYIFEELAIFAKTKKKVLFEKCLVRLLQDFGIEYLKEHLADFKKIMINNDNWDDIFNDVFHELLKKTDKKFVVKYWDSLVFNLCKTDGFAQDLLVDIIVCFKVLIKSEEDFEYVIEKSTQLKDLLKERDFRSSIERAINGLLEIEDLNISLKFIFELIEKSENSDFLIFFSNLKYIAEIFKDEKDLRILIVSIKDILEEIGKHELEHKQRFLESLFNGCLPHMLRMQKTNFNFAKIEQELLNVFNKIALSNFKNIHSLFEEDYYRHIEKNEANIIEHIYFYNQILEKNMRNSKKILLNLYFGLKEGIIDVHLKEEEVSNILEFMDTTQTFPIFLYKAWKKDRNVLDIIERFQQEKILNNRKGVFTFEDCEDLFKQACFEGFTLKEKDKILIYIIQTVMPAYSSANELFLNLKHYTFKGKYESMYKEKDFRVPKELIGSIFGAEDDYIIVNPKKTLGKVNKHKIRLMFLKIPYWKNNAGVCIANVVTGGDKYIKAFMVKDNLYSFAIIDETLAKIRGFVNLCEQEIDGEKVLINLGIDPSVNILRYTDSKALFTILTRRIDEIKQIRKCEYVISAKDEKHNITSERKDIRNLLAKELYEFKSLDKEICWVNLSSNFEMSFRVAYVFEEDMKIRQIYKEVIETINNRGAKKIGDLWLKDKVEKCIKELKSQKKYKQYIKRRKKDNKTKPRIYIEKIRDLKKHKQGEKIKAEVKGIYNGYINDFENFTIDIETQLEEINGGTDAALYIARDRERNKEIVGYVITKGRYLCIIKKRDLEEEIHGIGTSLMQFVLDDLLSIYFHCDISNKKGEKFYDKFNSNDYYYSKHISDDERYKHQYEYHISLKPEERDPYLMDLVSKVLYGPDVDKRVKEIAVQKKVELNIVDKIKKLVFNLFRTKKYKGDLLNGAYLLAQAV